MIPCIVDTSLVKAAFTSVKGFSVLKFTEIGACKGNICMFANLGKRDLFWAR